MLQLPDTQADFEAEPDHHFSLLANRLLRGRIGDEQFARVDTTRRGRGPSSRGCRGADGALTWNIEGDPIFVLGITSDKGCRDDSQGQGPREGTGVPHLVGPPRREVDERAARRQRHCGVTTWRTKPQSSSATLRPNDLTSRAEGANDPEYSPGGTDLPGEQTSRGHHHSHGRHLLTIIRSHSPRPSRSAARCS